MIFMTDEENDRDLVPLFGGLATVMRLPFGDWNWLGVWDGGQPIWVWGDRKKIGDLVSCVTDTNRLLAQIQKAYEAGFRIFFVVIEANYRPSPTSGMLQTLHGKEWRDYHLNPKDKNSPMVEYSRIDNYLNQLDFYLGVRVRISRSPRETARMVIDLYHLFQQPPEEHSSLKKFEVDTKAKGSYLQRPTLIRKIANQLPHVGWEKSQAFEDRFGTAKELCQILGLGELGKKELMSVDGVGKKIASDIVEAIEQ